MTSSRHMSGQLEAEQAMRLMWPSHIQQLRIHITLDCPHLHEIGDRDTIIAKAIGNLNAQDITFENTPEYHFFKAIQAELTRMQQDAAITKSPLFRYPKKYFDEYTKDGFYPGLLKKLAGDGLRDELRIDAARFGRPEQTPAKLDELIMYAMSRIHQQPDNILDEMSPGGAAETPLTKDLQRLAAALKSEMDLMLDEEIAKRSGNPRIKNLWRPLQQLLQGRHATPSSRSI